MGKLTDAEAVENVTREAFWNLYVPGCDEHYLMHTILTHPDFIPDLYHVAVLENEIVGCIVFTKSYIENEDGARLETATFGPVCVLPGYQHEGIGSELIKIGAMGAQRMGYPAVIILGDPHNYCKHGFRNTGDYAISDSEGRYPLGQLIRVLDDKRIPRPGNWKFVYSDVYNNVNRDEVEAFDKRFPPKEKAKEHSQILFDMLIRSFVDPRN